MPVAHRYRVGTLFGKDRRQLLEGSCRLSDCEVDLDPIAVDKVSSERSVVERIKPVPALDAFIIIRVDPG